MWDCDKMPDDSRMSQKEMGIKYLVYASKSKNLLSEEDTEMMLLEFESLQRLWPRHKDEWSEREEQELHHAWSIMYLQHWYKKWYLKSGRKDPEEALKRASRNMK